MTITGVSRIVVRSTKTDSHLLDIAGRLRHDGYLAHGHIDLVPSGRFFDERDDIPQSETFVAFAKDDPIGTMRLQSRASDESLQILSLADACYSKLESVVSSTGVTVEMNRFAVSPHAHGVGMYRVKAALLKAVMTASASCEASVCVAGVRKDHQPFYERYFGMASFGPDIKYPGVKFQAALLTCTMAIATTTATRRFPHVLPSAADRQRWERSREVHL